jgi:O-antigen ligase
MLQNKIITLLFLIFFILLGLSGTWFSGNIANASFTKAHIMFLTTGVLFLVTLYRTKSPDFLQLTWLKLALILMFLLGTLSFLWSVNIDFSMSKYLIWVLVIFAFYSAYHFKNSTQNLFNFVYFSLLAGVIIALIGISQYLFGFDYLLQSAVPGSTFSNKNMAAQVIVLLLPLSIFALTKNTKSYLKLIFITLSQALMLTFVFYTTTKAAFLSVLVEILLLSLFLGIKRKKLNSIFNWNIQKTYMSIFGFLVLMILVNISSEGFLPFWQTLSNLTDETINVAKNDHSARYLIWQVAKDMIADNPLFGTGLGSWVHNEIGERYGDMLTTYSETGYNLANYKNTHNDTLEILIELGLVGGVFLGFIVFSVIFSSWKIFKNTTENQLFYALLFIAISGSFVNMQFSFPYQLAVPSALFGIYMGFIAKKSEPHTLIKKIKFKFNKSLLMVFWLSIFTMGYATYISWIGSFSALSDIIQTSDTRKIDNIDSLFFYKGMQNSLSVVTNQYFALQAHKQVIDLDKKILKRWPRREPSFYRLGSSLKKIGKLQSALKVFTRGIAATKGNAIVLHVARLELLQILKDKPAIRKAFVEFLNASKNTRHVVAYKFLAKFAIADYRLWQYIPSFYAKFVKHHGYNCSFEAVTASHYINIGNYPKARSYIDTVLKNNDRACIAPKVLEILKL